MVLNRRVVELEKGRRFGGEGWESGEVIERAFRVVQRPGRWSMGVSIDGGRMELLTADSGV